MDDIKNKNIITTSNELLPVTNSPSKKEALKTIIDLQIEKQLEKEVNTELVENKVSEDKINVLFAAFEASPFMKTGGLGDVAGALPRYLNEIGVDTRLIMPLFSSIKEEYRKDMVKLNEFYVPFSWRRQYLGLYKLNFRGTIVYFLDNEYYFKRDKAYGYFDDGERIAFFSKALLESIEYMDFNPQILHLNDWHTALSAVYLREM